MKIVKDGKGRFVGQIIENGNLVYVRDGQGRPKGHYIKSADKTFDEKGHFCGYGEQLLRQLK